MSNSLPLQLLHIHNRTRSLKKKGTVHLITQSCRLVTSVGDGRSSVMVARCRAKGRQAHVQSDILISLTRCTDARRAASRVHERLPERKEAQRRAQAR